MTIATGIRRPVEARAGAFGPPGNSMSITDRKAGPGPTRARDDLRVLIVADNASDRFGGEAILPLHYFRHLRRRGVEVWMVVHDRNRAELERSIPVEVGRIRFVTDTKLDKFAGRMMDRLPKRLNDVTLAYFAREVSRREARRLVIRTIADRKIDVVHQPTPVSPKEPSNMHGLGVPVVIGPMNGGMTFPPAFAKDLDHWTSAALYRLGRAASPVLNRLMPGKLEADVLLVANDRTRRALPPGIRGEVELLAENGVDLDLWGPPEDDAPVPDRPGGARFLFIGRLVDWKAVDLLIEAFRAVVGRTAATLEIVGDGPERSTLERLAADPALAGSIRFSGWVSQPECADKLRGADALVLPSLYECGGAVVLEAMACARPVIATDWGGPADYLDATSGILIRPDSRQGMIADLADAMIRLATSPELRASMGRAGRARVVREFDWEKKVDRILEIYGRAIAGGSHDDPTDRAKAGAPDPALPGA